jgi:hypothetical protein
MKTPESKVKTKVRKILARYPSMYTYWPVPSGFGRTNIDVIGCYRRRFFGIEIKADGKKPTLKQTIELAAMARAMGKTFVITGLEDPAIDDLVRWLDQLTETVADDPDIPRDTVRRRPI